MQADFEFNEEAYCQTQGCSFTGNGDAVSEEERLKAYLQLMAHASE